MAANRIAIPRQLAKKISPGLQVFVGGGGTVVKIFGVAIATFGLYGTIVLHPGESPHHSLLVFLFGPWIFPSVVALCYSFSPFRPYRGVVYLQRTREVDSNDPVAMRLVHLFESGEARCHLWRQTLKLSGVIFLIMVALAAVLRRSLSWLPSATDIGGAALALTGSLLALSADHIGWGLTTWARREAVISAGEELK